MQIRCEIQTIRKGSLSMSEYFLREKQLSNTHASGQPLLDIDLQQIMLSGLDSAYDAIVTTLTATIDDFSMDNFQAHLLAFEMRLESQQSLLEQQPVANVANRNSAGLFLSQRKYIVDLLKKIKMDGAKPTSTPISSTKTLFKFNGSAFRDLTMYRSMVGSLQFLNSNTSGACLCCQQGMPVHASPVR